MSRKIKRQTKLFLLSELKDDGYWKSIKIKAKDLTHHFSSCWISIPLELKTGEEWSNDHWKVKRIK
jgi:hypothetical protein